MRRCALSYQASSRRFLFLAEHYKCGRAKLLYSLTLDQNTYISTHSSIAYTIISLPCIPTVIQYNGLCCIDPVGVSGTYLSTEKSLGEGRNEADFDEEAHHRLYRRQPRNGAAEGEGARQESAPMK